MHGGNKHDNYVCPERNAILENGIQGRKPDNKGIRYPVRSSSVQHPKNGMRRRGH